MEKFIANLANNYVSAKDEGIEAALIAANDTGIGQATPVAGAPGTEPSLNEGTQAAYDRITGKLPKLQVPETKTMEDHYKFRLAEAEKKGDKSTADEIMKEMAPIVGGAMVGSAYGPGWGSLAGATIAGIANSDPFRPSNHGDLDDLPDSHNGLGRAIP